MCCVQSRNHHDQRESSNTRHGWCHCNGRASPGARTGSSHSIIVLLFRLRRICRRGLSNRCRITIGYWSAIASVSASDVRYWRKADIACYAECLLSGVKRTSCGLITSRFLFACNAFATPKHRLLACNNLTWMQVFPYT